MAPTSDDLILPGSGAVPRHVAVIMDGNGRWAEQRGQMRTFGHGSATAAVRSTVEAAMELGVETLTLFAFSSENWRRPREEVEFLMSLFSRFLDTEMDELDQNGVRISFIGDMSRFGEELRSRICRAQERTAGNQALQLNVAANYGGRWDIVNACRRILGEGSIAPEDLTEEIFARHLATASTEVDLMIRTGGEMRISNFLIWQLAYAELYVTDVLWPDFSREDFRAAVRWFASRERRFGCTGEQIRSPDPREDQA